MEEAYIKSLQMIKEYKIKNEKEYNKLLKEHLILRSETLKFMTGKKFKEIIKLAKGT